MKDTVLQMFSELEPKDKLAALELFMVPEADRAEVIVSRTTTQAVRDMGENSSAYIFTGANQKIDLKIGGGGGFRAKNSSSGSNSPEWKFGGDKLWLNKKWAKVFETVKLSNKRWQPEAVPDTTLKLLQRHSGSEWSGNGSDLGYQIPDSATEIPPSLRRARSSELRYGKGIAGMGLGVTSYVFDQAVKDGCIVPNEAEPTPSTTETPAPTEKGGLYANVTSQAVTSAEISSDDLPF